MTITFNIQYFTNPGEIMAVQLLLPAGAFHEMKHDGAGNWTATVELDGATQSISYRYCVVNGNEVTRNEWGAPHSVSTDAAGADIVLYDRWQDMPANKPYYSKLFTDCINRRENPEHRLLPRQGQITISIEAPMVAPDETVVVAGSCPALGDWDVTKAPAMNDALFPTWQLNIGLAGLPLDIEYKMVIVKTADRSIVKWEEGENRHLSTRCFNSRDAICCGGLIFRDSSMKCRASGVAIPVFSLRSDKDCGIGDFYGLKMMIDWAAATGQNVVQILPINDTTMSGTWTDSYPYNANSTFALNPVYLHLEAVGTLADPERMKYYRDEAEKLNKLKEIDYVQASRTKLQYTRELFAEQRASITAAADFKAFVDRNIGWLKAYAAFCVLRDINNTADFNHWGEYAHYDEAAIDRFIAAHPYEIEFVYFQQYYLDKQLREVHEYARQRRIAIKGDIPIGISRTSVDAWTSPRLFNLDCQAGAPPDDFSVLGQNWGFPTYNWEQMSLDGFKWWKERFMKMAEYFDAYRIDHVLGFFRIWEIPQHAIHGLLGTFNPALPLTADDITNDYGFPFDPARHTQPCITDDILNAEYSESAEQIKAQFVTPTGEHAYELKPQFATQRQVAQHFDSIDDNESNRRLREALLSLIDNVLFIEDPRQKGKYHPRIAARNSSVYGTLDDYARSSFDRLYENFYYHRHNRFWYDSAMRKLPSLIDATTMLTCAEDLGMIPHCVPEVMDKLQILSLEIQRMPKQFGVQFGNPSHYPYLSVCTTSTHDMGGIRQWWEENREIAKAFYRELTGDGDSAPHFAEAWLCEKIVSMNLDSPAMLCILPLQDWLSIDARIRRENPREEQINNPANSRHYWRYRMHLTLENLLTQTDFNARIGELNRAAHRPSH